jgi:hypothetical protein
MNDILFIITLWAIIGFYLVWLEAKSEENSSKEADYALSQCQKLINNMRE